MASDAETIVINGAYQHSGEGNRSGLPLSVSDMVAKLPDPDHIKMFVGQLPRNYTEEDVQKLFQEFGPIHQINMLKDKGSGQSKGCCFITYYQRKSALDAQNALHNIRTLPGMHNPIQMKPADTENRSERKLFVGMISKKSSEEDVRKMFQAFGSIEECTILRDGNGSSRGCAFVTFASRQNAINAIRVMHHSLTAEGCSSPVVVKFADSTKDKDTRRQVMGLSMLAQGMNPLAGSYLSLIQQNGGLNLSSLLGAAPSSGMNMGGLQQFSSPNTNTLNTSLLGSFGGQGFNGNSGRGMHVHGAPSFQPSRRTSTGNSAIGSPISSGYGGLSNFANPSAYDQIAGLYQQLGLAKPLLSPQLQTALSKQTEGPEGCNLFIYHLPPEYGDLQLAQLFTTFGNVVSAKVFMDKQTGLSKCFGFVSFDNQVAAQAAIQQMNGFQIGLKRLKVQLKRSKDGNGSKPY